MKTYEDGVLEATAPITYEEAVTCGFPKPYSEVTQITPLDKLFLLRRQRLNKESEVGA